MSMALELKETVKAEWKIMVVSGILFALFFQVLMLLALIIRFQALPNYSEYYNWIGNVVWIIQSTPSWRDMMPIINEEWLIEIGKMNYEYGTGISEWSLNVVPTRLAVLFVLGTLIALCLSLLRRNRCELATTSTLHASTGLGAILVAMTNATMSWVVCCAAPSWVVGLAMLGLSVSTSLALETLGPTLNFTGFGLLAFSILYLARRNARITSSTNGVPDNA